MKITSLNVNGVTDPVGYGFDRLFASWKVTDTAAKKQRSARVEVSLTPDFKEILWQKEGT